MESDFRMGHCHCRSTRRCLRSGAPNRDGNGFGARPAPMTSRSRPLGRTRSSSCAACRGIFVQTTGPSSSPEPCRSGSARSKPRRSTSPRAHHGRMATSRASTPRSGTSCWTERYSIRGGRRRSSSRVGGGITTAFDRTSHSDIAHQHRKYSRLRLPRGRLCRLDPLRRPRSLWRRNQR